MSFTKTQNKFSKGIDDKADGTAVTIDETGNVGIGTDDPKAKLEINDGTQAVGSAAPIAPDMLIRGTGPTGITVFTDATSAGAISFGKQGESTELRWIKANNADNSMTFGKGNQTQVTIDADGDVGIGQPSPDAKFHVKETINSTGDVRLARFETFTTGDNAYLDLHVNNKTNSVDFRSSGTASGGFSFGDGIKDPYLLINAQGNVGIGVNPTTGTFDLSAKEQLAEWKTKAKKASWEIVTDGEFSQEPTEELVEQWIETRAAGDKLQVNGHISSTGNIIAKGAIANIYADSDSGAATLGLKKNGNSIFYMQMSASADGFYWGANSPDGSGFRNVGGYTHSLDRWSFNSSLAYFSGTVTAGNATGSNNGAKLNAGGAVQAYRKTRDAALNVFEGNGAGVITSQIRSNGDAEFSGTVTVEGNRPVSTKLDLITTLSTLRKATQDETTLEGLRDSIGNAISGLVEKFEAEIAGTMDLVEE